MSRSLHNPVCSAFLELYPGPYTAAFTLKILYSCSLSSLEISTCINVSFPAQHGTLHVCFSADNLILLNRLKIQNGGRGCKVMLARKPLCVDRVWAWKCYTLVPRSNISRTTVFPYVVKPKIWPKLICFIPILMFSCDDLVPILFIFLSFPTLC